MYSYKRLWISPTTTEDDPATLVVKLQRGVIVRWHVGFPDGCADLVHLTVYHFEHQILPANEDESLFWNNYVFDIPDHYVLDEEPYEIELRGWSDDDAYWQYVTVGIAVEPIEEVSLKDMMGAFLRSMVGGA